MILILGGTTEGRTAVKVADEAGKPYFYSTKGEWQEIQCKHGIRITGGMDTEKMESFCRQNNIRLLVDAAHPFASQLHRTVDETSRTLHLPVIRFERKYPPRTENIIWCEDYADAIYRLEKAGTDRLLALTGVQTIGKLRPYWEKHTCWFRVLERETSITLAQEQGFPKGNLVFYHAGESEALLLEILHPQAILTKESGESGGFSEKVKAAQAAKIPVFAIKRPPLPRHFMIVTGEYGLRKQIEKNIPAFYPLRSGYTTGACATAAAKAALTALILGEEQKMISFRLPDDEEMTLPVAHTEIEKNSATCTVVKDAGDDPDVTHGASIVVTVSFSNHPDIRFLQGEGVGRVTLPGLGLEIGEPAINRIPRQMIMKELSALYDKGLDVTISVPGGKELAQRTFNPKLGIVDGISIIGTSGIVRPFSSEAFVEAIRREVEVCVAVGLDGSYEKDDNLRLAQEVAKALKKSGVNVIMTRSDDSDTQLDSRSKIANKAKADIFVSLHRNSTANPNTTKGIEIWIHSSGSERSYAAADDILSNLEEVGITANRGVRIGTQGDSDDDYAVIRDTDMTSMIVEMGFMTNQDDLDYFNENLENYAKAISNGVVQWLNDYVQ